MNLQRSVRTWEFIVLALTVVGSWLTAVASESVGYDSAIYLTAAAAGAYALARGLAKVNHDGKDWWYTTEVWICVIAAAQASLAALNETISTHTYGILVASLTAASVLANGLRKIPAVQVNPTDDPTSYPPGYTPDPGVDDGF